MYREPLWTSWVSKVDRKCKERVGEVFLQRPVFSQGNLLLHSKHRTGLSSLPAVFSENQRQSGHGSRRNTVEYIHLIVPADLIVKKKKKP